MGATHSSYPTLLATVLSLPVIYTVSLVIHRLYFSPLAKFPGPKLAAATHWYQRYFDLVARRHGGQFLWEIRRIHAKHGPIVRITPDELHIDDANFWHEVYCNSSSTRPIDKQEKLRHRFGVPDAVFSTPGGEQHRVRRQAMASFFSKQRLRDSQDIVNGLVERVSRRITAEYAGSERVLDVGDMFSCLAVDIVTEMCFRRCTDCTKSPNFKAPLVGVTANTLWVSHWNAHFKFLHQWIEWLPVGVVAAMVPLFKPILDLRSSINEQVAEILSDMNKNSSGTKDGRRTDRATIFDDILTSNLPSHELSFDRLTQEAFALTSAGMETVKSTMTLAIFHVLDQPTLYSRLQAELREAIPDPDVIPSWIELEKLPYLTAVINESLRLGYGTVQRSPRINRCHTLHFGEWVIPPRTAVGMDSYHMHSNERIFPDPFVFRPERWLHEPKSPDSRQPLTNYLTTFGSGSRICIAMHLAYMELYVALAMIFRRHEFQLFETDRSDVEFALEMLAPMPHWGSRGVRVLVKK